MEVVAVEFPVLSGHSSLALLFCDVVEFTMATSATLRLTLRQYTLKKPRQAMKAST